MSEQCPTRTGSDIYLSTCIIQMHNTCTIQFNSIMEKKKRIDSLNSLLKDTQMLSAISNFLIFFPFIYR